MQERRNLYANARGRSAREKGRRDDADAELAVALAFYRRARATAYVREAEALLKANTDRTERGQFKAAHVDEALAACRDSCSSAPTSCRTGASYNEIPQLKSTAKRLTKRDPGP